MIIIRPLFLLKNITTKLTCRYEAESPEFVEGAESPEIVEGRQRNSGRVQRRVHAFLLVEKRFISELQILF
ncbi:MAG: hypothetical protein JRJ45_02495 [Deltaproteobacteria bacterium]|nr:hypothetical protein [Deltaproteobacteria bacterium]